MPNPPTLHPHLNEDRVVRGEVTMNRKLADRDFFAMLAKIPVGPANKAFEAPLEFANGKAYIRTNTRYPSLQAFRVRANSVQFFEENYKGKRTPRCRITAGGRAANLSITATDIREMFRASGIGEVAKKFAGTTEIHIRLGLARGFGDYPERCYMQVNGIYKL